MLFIGNPAHPLISLEWEAKPFRCEKKKEKRIKPGRGTLERKHSLASDWDGGQRKARASTTCLAAKMPLSARVPTSATSHKVAARRHLSPFRTSSNLPNSRRVSRGRHSFFAEQDPARSCSPSPAPFGPARHPGRAAAARDHLSPHSLGSFLLSKPRAHSHSPPHWRVRFAPQTQEALPGRRQPPGARHSRPFRPLTPYLRPSRLWGASALHLHVQAGGSRAPTRSPPTTSSLGLRPPRPGRAPRSTWPPLPRRRSRPLPAPRAPVLRAHSSRFPPPRPLPLREAGGGPRRARRRGQWAPGLLWPLPRAAANRGGRWW